METMTWAACVLVNICRSRCDSNGRNVMDGVSAQRGANAAKDSGKPQDLGGVINSECNDRGGVGANRPSATRGTRHEGQR